MTAEEGIHALLAHLRLKGYRSATIDNYSDQLKRFQDWLRRRRIGDLRALSRACLLGYQADVRREPISRETQALRIRAVKRLYGYLVEQGHLLLDPTEGLQEISRRNALPKPVLSLTEMKGLLAAPDVTQPHGLRDRALLEVLYATGVRVGELQQVLCTDLNLREGTMHLRVTKSGQPRVVPLGHHAVHWLRRYLDEVRPWQVRYRPFEPALFVVKGGRALRPRWVRQALKQYARIAGIQKAVSPHLLRHSCATHLLRAGADIRAIQELLGHSCLSSTVLYTRVAPWRSKRATSVTIPETAIMLLSDAVRRYLNAMAAVGRSPHTLRGAKSALKELVAVLGSLDVTNVEQLTHDELLRYREALSWRLTDKGTPLSARSQSELLGHLRAFCRWMVEQDWLVSDPSKRIPNPRKPQQLPKAILDETEVASILAQPDLRTATGYRNRVILEVLYSSAIRREEAAHLLLDDVDTTHGFLIVREGKNRKDRAVPIGGGVCELLQTYVAGVRAEWPGASRDRHLFLNRFGHGMSPIAVWQVVRKSVRAAHISRAVSTHTFRHSCATHMLRAGAPIRHLQEMLGHASIETTQVYTRVTITDLKAVHRRFHPREQDPEEGKE